MNKNKINTFFWLICLPMFALSFISCISDNQGGAATPGPAPAAVNYSKTLLVIGDDRSGSTNDIRKLTEDDYKDLFTAVSEKGGGAVAVGLIGNPQMQNKEPYLLTLKTLENLQPYDPKDTHLTLSQKSKIKLENERRNAGNKRTLQANAGEISVFVDSVILPNVINYKPSGIDHTNLDDAISRINILVNEPGYQSYGRIIVVFVSDGQNQPGNGVRPIQSRLTHSKASVYLVGWETGTNCFEVQAIENFSNKEGLIDYIKNL